MRKVLVFISMLMALSSLGQNASITAIITNSADHTAIADAHVVIAETGAFTTTASDGSFSFSNLQPGSYTLQVKHISYGPYTQQLKLGAGNNHFSIQLVPEIYETKTIVITATRSERDVNAIPARVEVISRKEIESLPWQKTDDILQYISGVNVSRPGGIYSMRPVVTLRGLSGDEQGRTLVLIDGAPINKGDEGGANWNRINKDDIERIEIYKGPGSSLYGNNAMGGMINIITRVPDKKIEGNASAGYGTYNTKTGSFFAGSKFNKKAYAKLSGFATKSDGYNAVPDSLKTNPDYSVPRFLEEYALSAKTGYAFNKSLNLELQYDFYKDKRGEGEKIELPDGEYRHFDTHFFRGRVRGLLSEFQYDLLFYYQHEDYFRSDERISGGNYTLFDVSSDRKDQGIILNMNYPLSPFQTISFGSEAKRSSVDGGDYYQTSPDSVVNAGKMDNFAAYVQDEINLLDNKIKILAGLRYDLVRFYDGSFSSTDGAWAPILPELKNHKWTALSPRVSASYRFSGQNRFYISYAFGFRASILDDLCRSGWMWVGPKIANPELGPEKINTYEAGTNINVGTYLKILTSVFFSKGKDFLYYVQTSDSLWGKRHVFQRENITAVKIFGAELQLQYNLTEQVTLFANYTFNHSEIDEFTKNPELSGKTLTFTPMHQAKAGLNWNNKIVNTNINVVYKSKQYTDDNNRSEIAPYTTLDISLSRKFLRFANVSLGIQNVFDNRHIENTFYMSPGRVIMLKTGFEF